MAGPLEGLVVADLSQLAQGPFATQILGDLGAEIIKIEPPKGDWMRHWALADAYPGGESISFLSFNRNKRSIAIDLKKPQGVELLRRIVARCDVVIENFRPGVMDRLGIGYEALREFNPRLIYCASSGYGQDGPYAQRPGQDLLIQALTGFVGLNGRAGDAPVPVATGIADLVAGYHIVFGVLAALYCRDHQGVSQRVDVNLLNALLALQVQELTTYLHTEDLPERSTVGISHPYAGAPFGLYETADGYIAIAMNPINTLARVLGLEGFGDHGSSNVVQDRDELWKRFQEAFWTKTTVEWVELLLAEGLWCAPVNDYSQVVRDPQIEANGMIVNIEHPTAGEVRTVGPSLSFSETPASVRLPPPLRGEHANEILQEFAGCSSEEIESLRAEEVVL